MSEAKDAINVYTCEKGDWRAVTVNRDAGTTPFMIRCERCGATCTSAFYRVPQTLKPTHEFFKPANDAEIVAVCGTKGRLDALTATRDHVSMGGLLLRRIAAA